MYKILLYLLFMFVGFLVNLVLFVKFLTKQKHKNYSQVTVANESAGRFRKQDIRKNSLNAA